MQDIIYLIALCLSVLNAIITFVRTGTIKKEVSDLRSPDYQKSDDQKQSFSNKKIEYVLNERTNELEKKVGEVDLQARINSSVDTALDRVLQRLQPESYDLEGDLESQWESAENDLIDFAEILDRAEEYREQFGMSLKATTADIYKRVQEESDKLKARLDSVRIKKQALQVKQNTEVQQNVETTQDQQESE